MSITKKDIMELECFKYKEKMKAEEAFCRHPGDYCKYRTSCVIQFMSSENKDKNGNQGSPEKTQPETNNSDIP